MGSQNQAYLDLRGFAGLTGLSPATIRRLVRKRKIRFFQPHGPGGKLLFPPDALEQATRTAPAPPDEPVSGADNGGGAVARGPRPKWMLGAEQNQLSTAKGE